MIPSNTTTLPTSNTTTLLPGNTTTLLPGNTTTLLPGNTTTLLPGNTTSAPTSTSITTPARIHFSLSFRIVNLNFNASLLDPSTSYYLKLQVTIQILVSTAPPPSPPGALPLPGWGLRGELHPAAV
uniref:SEA domain-containing protein n=1 Tax=Chelydra serpentina TaxID=8475 RepID=A0A8C3XPD5_CHESE